MVHCSALYRLRHLVVFLLPDGAGPVPMIAQGTVEDGVCGDIDVDLEDSDFEPGTDRELLGLFFPEVGSQ